MNKNQLNEAVTKIRETYKEVPKIGLILGSGLGVLANEINGETKLPYSKIPYFPISTVEGHKGQFVFGELKQHKVVVMEGRFHFYEGYSMEEVTFPVRVMKELGIETLIVTNAAGGVNKEYKAGDLMLISDHINFTGTNPLIGINNSDFGPRFPDMSEAYSRHLRKEAHALAQELGIPVREGIYAGFSGPTYETPAEIRMMRMLGVDAVGMSTVPEVIVANHASLSVLGISCITNMAAGILDQPLSHREVMETAEMARATFLTYIKAIIQKI